MAARTKLDGAGQAKLKTLEDANTVLLRIHGLVEQYALAVQRRTSTLPLLMNLKRQLPALGGMLKNQFGVLSDQVFALALATSRGSSELLRIRQLREGVAQLGLAIEVATRVVIEKHTVTEDAPGARTDGDR